MTTAHAYSFKPSGQVGLWLMRLVVVSVAFNIVSSVETYGRLRSVRYVIRVVPWSPSPPPPRLSLVPQPFGAVASLVGVTTIITWLVWQHRVTANVWARGPPVAT